MFLLLSRSSFLGPYLDPASSTLLAPLAYALFLLRLRSWSCYPRSFAFFELREVLLSLFSCLSWYLLCRHIVLALLTQSFLILFLLLLPFLDIYYLIMSSLLWTLCLSLSLFHNVYILPHYSFLFTLYLNSVPSSLFFSFFERNDYDFSCLCFLSFLVFIIYLHLSYFFEFRLSW